MAGTAKKRKFMMELHHFLPKNETGNNAWPCDVYKNLKFLSKHSLVNSADSLSRAILILRQGMEFGNEDPRLQSGIERFFYSVLQTEGRYSRRNFMMNIFPFIAKLAMGFFRLYKKESKEIGQKLDGLVGSDNSTHQDIKSLSILAPDEPGMVMISQELAASILACAFLCLFPTVDRKKFYLPPINFDQLFCRLLEGRESQKEKLLCILHYFIRINKCMPTGCISFERKFLQRERKEAPFLKSEYWESLTTRLCKFEVKVCGKIEDSGSDFLQVDFANKFLGGGSLGGGCVQEEIRFMTSPELIVGMLFCPQLQDSEAIEIIGAERFSSYTGYAKTFAFDGDYQDQTASDSLKRRKTTIVAIDALEKAEERQYQTRFLLRELNKAFCGFRPSNKRVEEEATMEDDETVQRNGETENIQTGVATGNWGCGVFGGDLEIKSMIQWIAASQALKKKIHYYTFGDPKATHLSQVIDLLTQEEYTVGKLWNDFLCYSKSRKEMKFYERYGFFEWLMGHESRASRASGICFKSKLAITCLADGKVPRPFLDKGDPLYESSSRISLFESYRSRENLVKPSLLESNRDYKNGLKSPLTERGRSYKSVLNNESGNNISHLSLVKSDQRPPFLNNESDNNISNPSLVESDQRPRFFNNERLKDISNPSLVESDQRPFLNNESENNISNPSVVESDQIPPFMNNESDNNISNPSGVKSDQIPLNNESDNNISHPSLVESGQRPPFLNDESNNNLSNPSLVEGDQRPPFLNNESENNISNPSLVASDQRPPFFNNKSPSLIESEQIPPFLNNESDNNVSNPSLVASDQRPLVLNNESDNNISNPSLVESDQRPPFLNNDNNISNPSPPVLNNESDNNISNPSLVESDQRPPSPGSDQNGENVSTSSTPQNIPTSSTPPFVCTIDIKRRTTRKKKDHPWLLAPVIFPILVLMIFSTLAFVIFPILALVIFSILPLVIFPS